MRNTVEAAWLVWQSAEPMDAAVITWAVTTAVVLSAAAAAGWAMRHVQQRRHRNVVDMGDWIADGNVRPRLRLR